VRVDLRISGIVALSTMLSLAAVQASEWTPYANARFNYQVEIPPGFSSIAEAENGDGGTSQSSDDRSELRVWGGYLTEGSFGDEVTWRIDGDIKEGWQVPYRKVRPDWASWSGKKQGRIFYQRTVAACEGASASFRIEYDATQAKAFDGIVARLVKSLRAGHC
jgi:hypothetical protein